MCSAMVSCCKRENGHPRYPRLLRPSRVHWEPAEVRSLKKQLGSFTCNCPVCKNTRNRNKKQTVEVQVSGMMSASTTHSGATNSNSKKKFPHLPPNYGSSNPFRLMAVIPRLYKEKEVETDLLEFQNKGTSKTVKNVEKSTSLIFKPVLKYAELPLWDSSSVLTSTDSLCLIRKKSSLKNVMSAIKCSDDEINTSPSLELRYDYLTREQLAFEDATSNPMARDEATSDSETDTESVEQYEEPICGICKNRPLIRNPESLENYINSIRPPTNFLYYASSA